MLLGNSISPFDEMLAYETLYASPSVTQKTLAERFRKYPHSILPSKLLQALIPEEMFLKDLMETVRQFIERLSGFSVSVNGAIQYPDHLRDANYPLELFYYRGFLGMAESRCVSVVGARKASPDGQKRAARLAKELTEANFTIVSGLAEGIDTAAMTAAIEAKGRTIGVIGTPINESYPKKNAGLQEQVASEFLLVSQVPFYRYNIQHYLSKKHYFPQRNETMAALSEATIIVEASDTSGSLTQARAAIAQKRKLFILNNCFENSDITWPAHYEKLGAVRVRKTEDILKHLETPPTKTCDV